MKTLSEILTLSTAFLKQKGIENARRSAEELLSFILKKKRIDLYLYHDLPLEEKEVALMRKAISRRGNQEPLEYIIGEIEFFGAQIKTDQRALIPRQETEILVEKISKELEGAVLWDVCTGSGCIGISLKKKFPHLQVTLSDISEEALSLARENALKNSVQVEFLKGDLLMPFEGKKADIIVCNPPYISEKEFPVLEASVRDFEPKTALVGGINGLFFYERLSKELPKYLNPSGKVFLEMGATQKNALSEIFSIGPWERREFFQDWAGKDRFFFLEMQALSLVS